MDLEKLTDRAKGFLQSAQTVAIRLNHQRITPDHLLKALAREMPAGVTWTQPEGGMFVMVDVRKTGLSGEEFARRLLAEENVVTMPGESFGAGGGGHLRVALTVDEDQIKEACKRIAALANRV